MTHTINPDTRLNSLASDAADQFTAPLLHNRVHEQVKGQHGDESALRATLEAAEQAYHIAERREEVGSGAAFDAAETLNDTVDTLVDEQVARACAVIITEADDWTDAWDAVDIHAAQAEARRGVSDHVEIAEQVGVLEDCRDAEVPEVAADA